jgi:hypothetical protein
VPEIERTFSDSAGWAGHRLTRQQGDCREHPGLCV